MPSQPVNAHRALASDKRMAMVHLLQRQDAPMSADEIACGVGLHVNTVREHLERLMESGLVTSEVERRHTRGRPRILYSAAPDIEAPGDARARDQLVRALLAGLGTSEPAAPACPVRLPVQAQHPGGQAEECGRTWARLLGEATPPADHADLVSRPEAQAQLADLRRHLKDLGFEPEADPAGMEVHLHRCPFVDLVAQAPDIVCQVHLGLSQGVLENHDGPLVATWLERFVGPHHCILHLGEREPSSADDADDVCPAAREHDGPSQA